MKRWILGTILLGLSLIAVESGAGGVKEFVLKDGSVLRATIVSYSNGTYVLDSGPLGKIELSEDKISEIRFDPSRTKTQSAKPSADRHPVSLKALGISSSDLKAMEQKLLQDPKTRNLIEELKSDPSVQSILEDENLMDAVNQGDLGRLMKDPKIESLMNNQKIGEILERNK